MPGSKLVLAAAAAIVLAAASGAGAQGLPVGPEFLLNVTTAGDQVRPAIAVEGDGGYVVAWLSGTSAIAARRLAPSGVPRGPEIAVNVAPIGTAARPAVAAFPGGGFVIAWHAPDGSANGVFVRRFDAAGQPIGGEIVVNATLTGDQIDPRIAAGPFGYVMAWSSAGNVVGRLLGADGTPLGVEIPVGAGQLPAVAWRANGLVFAWTTGDAVYIRLFEGTGAPAGAAFVANGTNPPMPGCAPWYARRAIAVASAADGSFTVSWDLAGNSVCGGFLPLGPFYYFQFGSFIRRYTQDGVPLGPESRVNVHTAGGQKDPSVGVAASGATFVAWSSIPEAEGCYGPFCIPAPDPPPPPQDGSGAGVYARRFDASGTDVGGGEFRVNVTSLGDQQQPAVAMAGPQKALAVFVQPDGSGSGIFGRLYGVHSLAEPTAFAVDTTVLQYADGNGVLEPNEAVIVAPSWRNLSGAPAFLTGTAVAFAGPPGPFHGVLDETAGYGLLAHGIAASCQDINDCYSVTVLGTRPVEHWDALLTEQIDPPSLAGPRARAVHIGDSFGDVARASSFYRFVETVFHNGVMPSCAPGSFCPFVAVRRESMAPFVLKAHNASFVPPACVAGSERFIDVPASSPYCAWIEELARRGVVAGCGGGRYCPALGVSREALAVYLLATKEGTGFVPPACTTPLFADVPASSGFCRWIEELARRGVVTGCGNGLYCPALQVARDQMSVFLTGTYGLLLYVP